jgi:PAS domain-containing protein
MAMKNNARRQMKESPGAIDDRLFRLMVGSVIDHAVIGIDLEGCIFSWNPGAKKTFGYLEKEIMGESFSILFTPEDRRLGLPEYGATLATGASATAFRRHARPDLLIARRSEADLSSTLL